MKKITWVAMTGTISIAILLVSSVSAVPYVNEEHIKKLTNDEIQGKLNKIINSKSYQKLKSIVDQNTNDTVKLHIRQQVTQRILGNVSPTDNPYLPIIVEILIVIFEACVLLFGNNFIGIGIGSLIVTVLAFISSVFGAIFIYIPICIVLYSTGFVTLYFQVLNDNDFFYMFGAIGLIVALILILPLTIIVTIIGAITGFVFGIPELLLDILEHVKEGVSTT